MSVRGVALALHPPGDYVSDVIRQTGDFFEAAILDHVVPLLRRGCIVDAGAMIGNHTAYLAQFADYTEIHAFEPLPANAALLRANVAPFANVHVHELALSDRHRSLRMAVDGNFGHARVDKAGTVEVAAAPLDALELRDVSLLKIDVERHEPEVLAGARLTLTRDHPLVLIEDWDEEYGALLPSGYRLAAAWPRTHQTYLYEWSA